MRKRATGRAGAALAALAIATAACSTSSTTPEPATSSQPAPAAEKLHVDFGKPERWRTVTTFSYGKRRDQLGPPGGRVSENGVGGIIASTPSAIAVVGKTVWVLDQVKRRAAHFTLDGRYLGAVGGIPRDARDLPRAITKVEDAGTLDYSVGTVDQSLLDISMKPAWDRRYELTSRRDVVFDIRQAQVHDANTYLWLDIQEDRVTKAAGGQFLLELDRSGQVVRLARIATSHDDSQIFRPFFVAGDGSIYQLFASNTRAELRVRP